MCYIYTITSLKKYDGERLIYVGSTKDYDERFRLHKSDCFNPNSNGYNTKVYTAIRKHGWDAFVMEVIEVCDDNMTDKELLFREQFYIDKYDSKRSMNSYDAITGLDRIEYHRLYDAEYYKKNREKRLAQSNEWIKNHRERMTELNREWQKNNRDRYNEIQRNSYHKRKLWKNTLTELSEIEPSFFC